MSEKGKKKREHIGVSDGRERERRLIG